MSAVPEVTYSTETIQVLGTQFNLSSWNVGKDNLAYARGCFTHLQAGDVVEEKEVIETSWKISSSEAIKSADEMVRIAGGNLLAIRQVEKKKIAWKTRYRAIGYAGIYSVPCEVEDWAVEEANLNLINRSNRFACKIKEAVAFEKRHLERQELVGHVLSLSLKVALLGLALVFCWGAVSYTKH